jgi:hypothetical protein
MNHTTRRFHRTLDSAFNDADRADSGDWVKYRSHRVADRVIAAGLAVFVVSVLFGWLA